MINNLLKSWLNVKHALATAAKPIKWNSLSTL